MNPLERLNDLLERATPGPWEWWTSNSWRRLSARGGRDGGVLLPVVQRSDGHPDIHGLEADKALIALAPVLASDLIALAEVIRQSVVDLETKGDLGHALAEGNLHAALSTVLAHIEDSLKSLEGDAP